MFVNVSFTYGLIEKLCNDFFYDDKKMVLSMLWKSMNQKDNIF